MDLHAFCRSLPKIELHAHLNGSVSSCTLKKLRKLQFSGAEFNQDIENDKDPLSLEEFFESIDIVHQLTNTPNAIFKVSCDVIKEFWEDNVIYLELRSTPREVEGSMTKKEYILAIIRAIEMCKIECPNILVKLLISVNRKHGYDAAKENIELAISMHKEYLDIVGIDLSGDPTQGDVFIELLDKCRKVGLKISAHCAEVPNEIEVMDIINFKPDRLGHCTCVHPNLGGSQLLFDMLLRSKIPVELCLTSNVKCKTVPSYESHHFKYLYENGHPLCISTDDKGVFNTSLSEEFRLVSQHFGLKKEDLNDISKASVQFAFVTEEEKAKLTAVINNFC
ncbi:adenosine deaminase-like protein [Orussus abietinus]|uniref:adenosine deaminase-like protein n=1 Tax=Orussus abietinus TaxID=222816 RepID=UPI00062595CE|nr:adenosine deaminase-like protein [Orussus abietinus]